MSVGQIKIESLLSTLSVQYSPLMDEQSFHETYARRKRNQQKSQPLNSSYENENSDNHITNGRETKDLDVNGNLSFIKAPSQENEIFSNHMMNRRQSKYNGNSLFTNENVNLSDCKKTHTMLQSKGPMSDTARLIVNGCIDDIMERIKSGEDVDKEDEKGFKLLHYACKFGQLKIVQELLNAGCDASAANSDRLTSLHMAVRGSSENVVRLLLEEGLCPDVREKTSGRTAVHEATLLPDVRILSAMISKLQEDPWEARRILKMSDKNGQTALHLAANGCMSEAVDLLLQAGADVATIDNNGLTPLHLTLLSHQKESECGTILNKLLEAGGELEVEGANQEKLSHLAAKVGCAACLNFLCAKGADLMAKDRLGRTPLHVAALEGKNDTVRYLLSKNVDVEDTDENGMKPIHLAIMNDHARIIQFFIDAGIDAHLLDGDGRTYAQIAVMNKRINVFEVLVKCDFVSLGIDATEDIMHYCSALGFIEFISILLNYDWDINLRDLEGRTALHRSLNHGHELLATFLINNGASVHVVDGAGATPLHYAVRWGGSDAILRLLIKKRASMNIRDRLGRTPLHYAASKFSIMSDLYILVSGGSILDAKDQMGLTPLHLAARFGNESLVRILLEKGAKYNIKDIDNFLPIDHARENNNKSIIARLLDHENKVNCKMNKNANEE